MHPTKDEAAVTKRGVVKKVAPMMGLLLGGSLSYVFTLMVHDGEGFLRPPGAAGEKVFASRCIRCGKCARSCPYEAIHIADMDAGVAVGTPYLIARQTPCYLCSDLPCIRACPTNALDHSINKREEIRMGMAVIIDREECLSLNGLRCEVCYRTCPLIDKAMTLVTHPDLRTGRHIIFEPVIHKDRCVGCGQCEHNCVLETAAIKVLPKRVASDKFGRHYIVEGQG